MKQEGGGPIRVLFLNTRSALGADVAVHVTLMRHLGAASCEVFLATNSRSADHAKLLSALRDVRGITIWSLDLGAEISGRATAGKLAGAATNVATMAGALLRLARFVRRNEIDVIHSTDRPRDALMAVLLARLTGRKSLLHLHIKWDAHMGRATTWAMARCDAALAISEFVRGSLVDGGVEPAKVYTALNATDTREFDPAKVREGRLRERLGVGTAPLLGVVARVMVWKGQLDLVEAFAKVRDAVPEAQLVIVGKEDTNLDAGESYAGKVRTRIAELGLESAVHWAGWIDDAPSVFADLDVVCVPSWEEPFGLVVTEAMAMRKPVVGYRSGALPEIIDEGLEGLLVTPKDYDAMARAIITLLCDPERREAIGRRGRERVLRQFTPQRQAAELAAIYRSVCGNG